MSTPWDIYVDERKVKGDKALGFLVVPNTASFLRKLNRSRNINGLHMAYEMHWTKPRADMREVATNWIHWLFQHRGAKFYAQEWPMGTTKEMVILKFLDRFVRRKKLTSPYNVVTFLDYDDDHSRSDIQNLIKETANIARCYHLDSRNNDCIQCCDLLLNLAVRLRDSPTDHLQMPALCTKIDEKRRLTNSELKSYLAGFLASKIDDDAKCFYNELTSGA